MSPFAAGVAVREPPSYKLSASLRPASTCPSLSPSSSPRRLVRSVLSSVTIWLTFTTESRSKPALAAARATLPGAAASLRFDVIATAVTVLIRERLNASAETTSTGRRHAGADPCFGPKSAHQTSPRTTISPQLLAAGQPRGGHRGSTLASRRHSRGPSSPRSRAPRPASARARSHTTGCAKRLTCGAAVLLFERVGLGSRLQFSQCEYNPVIPLEDSAAWLLQRRTSWSKNSSGRPPRAGWGPRAHRGIDRQGGLNGFAVNVHDFFEQRAESVAAKQWVRRKLSPLLPRPRLSSC